MARKSTAIRRVALAWAFLAFLAAIVAAVMIAIAGPLYRHETLTLSGAFDLLGKGFWVGVGAAAAGLVGIGIGLFARRAVAVVLALIALIGGGAASGWLYSIYLGAQAAPPIHDVATDPLAPPQFIALAAQRLNHKETPNGLEYGGGDTQIAQAEVQALAHFFDSPIGHASSGREAAIAACTQWDPSCLAAVQRAYYPDIRPLSAPGVSAERAFTAALATARDMGWKIVAADPATGHVEATATTAWFGFKDDVAVDVTASPDGSTVNVRSESRMGLSDLGMNAKRVRAYLDRLKSHLQSAA
ncbi:MAG: DUF1499 domain-containing protein [Gammaproteobacteria bacterium]